MFIFQDDDYKENETLEHPESLGLMDEYLKMPRRHQAIDQDVLSVTG